MEKAKEKQKEKNERGGEEMKNNGKSKYQRGITLIALVITIIVLLILVAVSIATLTGENGILTKANEAKVENSHAEVKEALRLEYANYVLEKNQGQITTDLIGYLKDNKKLIGELEEGKYKIDVEKLLNKTPLLGTGTDGTDVYKLEDNSDEEEVKYKIIYYGKTENENIELEILKDGQIKKRKEITFTLRFQTTGDGTTWDENDKMCTALEGMTWFEWANSEEYNNTELICWSPDAYVLGGNFESGIAGNEVIEEGAIYYIYQVAW